MGRESLSKKIVYVGLSLVMAVSFMVPTTAFAANTNAADATTADAQETSAKQNVVVESDYTNQYLTQLKASSQLAAGADVQLSEQDGIDGLFISGPAGQLRSQGLAVSKTLNFNEGTVSRLRVQAMCEHKTTATLACYLDDADEPIAKIELRAQSKASSWDLGTKDSCADLSLLKLSGEHTVTFKIENASAEQPKVLFKSFEFMEYTVPVVNFNIDEAQGTIDDMNSSENHSKNCYGSVDITVPDSFTSEYTGEKAQGGHYELDYVRGRGNSTWTANTAHKPYKIKLAQKQSVLSMPKSKHWVLLANYFDNSQLRNKITYWLSEQLGFEYTVRLEPVEVVMNGQYCGSYFLCEQVRVEKNRVNIDDLEDTLDATDANTISGGYLLSMDQTGDEHQGFKTSRNFDFAIESPSFEDYYNETQYNYIKDYVQNTEDAIYSSDFKDKDGKSFTEYLDADSAIDYMWLQEFSMNGDAYSNGSTYLYKKRNGKLYFGPAWDFDYVAWGSKDYSEAETSGWSMTGNMWVERLLQNKAFAKQYIERWQTLKSLLNELTRNGGKLDQYATRISKAVNYNVEKYGMTDFIAASEYGGDRAGEEQPVLSYTQEIERLRSWIDERASWVDQHVNMLSPIKCTVTFKADGKKLGTTTGYVGSSVTEIDNVPEKEGYSLEGWKVKYHVGYKRYLRMNNLTEEELIAKVGKAKAAKIKKNGYTENKIASVYDITCPGNITLTAAYSVNKAKHQGLVEVINGMKYEITGDGAVNGRTAKALGPSNVKAKKVTIAKKVKINGRSYTVTEIAPKAFGGCKKLKTLTIKGKSMFLRASTFKKLSKRLVIKVPRSSVSYYKSMIKGHKVKAA